MNKFVKLFPVVAMVMAVTFAFAFAPEKKVPSRKQAFMPITSTWQDIPLNAEKGTDYSCAGTTQDCTRQLDENNNVISGTVEKGVYAPL